MKRAHAPGLVMLGIVAACGCRESAGLHGAAAPATHAGEEAPARGRCPGGATRKRGGGRTAARSCLGGRGPAAADQSAARASGSGRHGTGPRALDRCRGGGGRGLHARGLLGRLDALHLRRAGGARRDAARQPVPTHLHRPRERPIRRGRRAAAAGRARTTSSSTASSPRCRCCGRDSWPTRSTPATTKRASTRSTPWRPSPTCRPTRFGATSGG